VIIIKQVNGENSIFNEIGLQSQESLASNLSPKELLEASLGLCIAITMGRMFERDHIEIEDHINLIKVIAIKEEHTSHFGKMNVSIEFPPHLSASYKKKILVSVGRACTIGNTLKNSITINTFEQSK